MKVVGYLLYGGRSIYQLELAYSALSALRWSRADARDVVLAVITDQPKLNFDLPIQQVPLTSREIAAWSLEGKNPHRMKVLALDKLLERFQCPVALVDTDTYFLDHPARLFERIGPGASLMHAAEDRVGQQALWDPLLAQLGGAREIAGIPVGPDSQMFNSGVIGVDPAQRQHIPQVLALLDQLYARSPIFNIEQFSLGAVLGHHTKLSICPDLIRHYWGIERDFIHLQTARLLQDFSVAGIERVLAELPKITVGLPNMRLRHKLAALVRSRAFRWDADYRFAYLSYLSGLASAARDSEYANVWVATAQRALASSLKKDHGSIRSRRLWQARRDFARLDESHIGDLSWLNADVKAMWLNLWRAAPN
jgi:hypothetical protein